MMTRANAQKMPPMLIPALTPALMVSEDEGEDASGVAAHIVVTAGGAVGGTFIEEDEGVGKEMGVMDGGVDDCDVEDGGLKAEVETGEEVEASDVEDEGVKAAEGTDEEVEAGDVEDEDQDATVAVLMASSNSQEKLVLSDQALGERMLARRRTL